MRRFLLSLAIASAVLAVVVGIALAWRGSAGTRATLPDGSVVRYVGSAVGNSTFTTEKTWHRVARRITPKPFQKWIPPTLSANCSSSSNSLTVYLESIDSSGTITSAKTWDYYGAEDDAGVRLQSEGGYCSFGSPALIGLTLRTWPRRQASFRLNFMDGPGKILGGLRIANPVAGPFPIWNPQALPQTQTNGPVVATLQSIRESRRDSAFRAAIPRWEVHSTDPKWRSATVRSTTFYDATGNEGQWLPRTERAWKAVAHVYRKDIEDFLPEERVVLDGLAVPAVGKFVGLDKTFERNGVKIFVQVLGGAGRLFITNGLQRAMMPPATTGESGHSRTSNGLTSVESWGSSQPFLMFEIQGQMDNDSIEFTIRDDRGALLAADSGSGYSGTTTSRMYFQRFSPPENTKSLTFEFAINRPVPFEFFINPADIQPSPAP